MSSGIYQIINEVNQKRYIGSSSDVTRRFFMHKSLLRRGKHPNKHLQSSWNKHGENFFKFKIIEEEIDEDNLIQRESYYFNLYGVFLNNCFYNILGIARRSKGNRKPLKKEHKLRISSGLYNFYKN